MAKDELNPMLFSCVNDTCKAVCENKGSSSSEDSTLTASAAANAVSINDNDISALDHSEKVPQSAVAKSHPQLPEYLQKSDNVVHVIVSLPLNEVDIGRCYFLRQLWYSG